MIETSIKPLRGRPKRVKETRQVKTFKATHREKAKSELCKLLEANATMRLNDYDTNLLAQLLVDRIKQLRLSFSDIFDHKRSIKIVNEAKGGGFTLGEQSEKKNESRNRAERHRGNNEAAIARRIQNEASMEAAENQKIEKENDTKNTAELILEEFDYLEDGRDSQHPPSSYPFLIDLHKRASGVQTLLGGLKQLKEDGKEISEELEKRIIKMKERSVAIDQSKWIIDDAPAGYVYAESQQAPSDNIGRVTTNRGSKRREGSIKDLTKCATRQVKAFKTSVIDLKSTTDSCLIQKGLHASRYIIPTGDANSVSFEDAQAAMQTIKNYQKQRRKEDILIGQTDKFDKSSIYTNVKQPYISENLKGFTYNCSEDIVTAHFVEEIINAYHDAPQTMSTLDCRQLQIDQSRQPPSSAISSTSSLSSSLPSSSSSIPTLATISLSTSLEITPTAATSVEDSAVVLSGMY